VTGLKGIAIGDGFTFPYEILSEVGTFAFHLGLVDFQERMRLEKVLLNASRHNMQNDMDAMHLDFDTALDYIVEKAGNVNVYDIKIDGEYEGTPPPTQNCCSPTSATPPSWPASTSSTPRSSTTPRPTTSTTTSSRTS
jgi:hypothetical protein